MDNTEGSQAISLKLKARKNVELRLSVQQIAIILGSILGDAYVHPLGKICFEHSATQQDYLRWKYESLKTVAYPKVAEVLRTDKRTNTKTVSYRFFLRQFFRPFRKIFYNDRKKVVPPELKNWLSPLLLAVWYMDDGYLDRNKYPILMTENFLPEDVLQLSKMLAEVFQLETLISKNRRIRIRSVSAPTFFQLIEPHIHRSMRYKLP